MSGANLASAYVAIIPSFQGLQGKLATGMAGPATAAGAATGQRVGKSMSGGFSASTSKIGKNLTKTLTPAAAAAGFIFKKVADDWRGGVNSIITATGASGAVLDSLTASMKTVGSRVPQDLTTVGQAIGEVNTRLGLTGEPLEVMTKKMLDFARLTGGEVTQVVANVTRTFGDWGVKTQDQAEAMDVLFNATKQSGIGLDRLTQLVVQYGAPLRQLGFSMEESIALFSKWEKEGVNTQTALAGFRVALGKLAKSGEDPKTALQGVMDQVKNAGTVAEGNAAAFEFFGARAGPDMAAAIREGRFEIDDMVAQLSNSEGALDDASERTLTFGDRMSMLANSAKGVVGPFAELGFAVAGVSAGIGPALIGVGKIGPGLKKAGSGIGGLAKAGGAMDGLRLRAMYAGEGISKVGASVGRSAKGIGASLAAGAKIGGAGLSILASGAVSGVKSLGMLAASATRAGLASTVAAVKMGIVKVATVAWTAAQWLLNAAMSANPLGLVVIAIVALIAAIVLLWNKSETFRTIVTAAWEGIKTAVSAVVDWFTQTVWPTLQTIWGWISTAAGVLWNAIKTYYGFIWNILKVVVQWIVTNLWPKIQTAWTAIKTGVQVLWQIFQQHWNAIRNVISTVVNWIVTNVWPKIQTAWTAIKTATSVLWNIVRTAFNVGRAVIGAVIGWIKTFIVNNFNTIKRIATNVWNGVKTAIQTAIDAAKRIINTVKDRIDALKGWFGGIKKSISEKLSGIATTIKAPFEAAFRAIRDLWNDTVGKLSWTVPDWVPGIGGKTISAPKLGAGATVLPRAGGTLVTLAERGRPESVVDTGLLNARLAEMEMSTGTQMPSQLVVVDKDGVLVGTMDVAASQALDGMRTDLLYRTVA